MNLNKKNKYILVIILIGLVSIGVLTYKSFFVREAFEPFMHEYYGSDGEWKAQTEITNLHLSGEQKHFDVRFEFLGNSMPYNEKELLLFTHATSQTMESLSYHAKTGYIRSDYSLEDVSRIVKVDDKIFVVSFAFPLSHYLEYVKAYEPESYKFIVSISGENFYKLDLVQ